MIPDNETPVFKDDQQAFEEAIESGRLVGDSRYCNFAGHYSYVGTFTTGDEFRHKETDRFLSHTTKGKTSDDSTE